MLDNKKWVKKEGSTYYFIAEDFKDGIQVGRIQIPIPLDKVSESLRARLAELEENILYPVNNG